MGEIYSKKVNENVVPTSLLYLDDTYLFSSESHYLETMENDRGLAVILRETIFYPQGGGQPADQGTIETESGLFKVVDVRLDEEGVVWHFGEFEKGSFEGGEVVKMNIDKDRRMLNSRLHSAGHLIDCAVEKLGLLKQLVPGKGFQFPPEPYIEYVGVLEDPQSLINEVESISNELIDQDLQIVSETLTEEEAERRNLYVPKGKPARFVTISGFTGMGCGGTHVNSTKEIGPLKIRNIKCKKGITKISYQLL